jgi:hypothetical protein
MNKNRKAASPQRLQRSRKQSRRTGPVRRAGKKSLAAVPARELLVRLRISAPTPDEVDAIADPIARGWIYGHWPPGTFTDKDKLPDSLRTNFWGVEGMLTDVQNALSKDPALHFDVSKFTAVSAADLANETKPKKKSSIGYYIGLVCHYARVACGLPR